MQQPQSKLSTQSLGAKNTTPTSLSRPSGASCRADDEVPWHSITSAGEVVEELESCSTSGLTQEEAERRVLEYGPNRLTPPDKPSLLRKLWDQLNNLLTFILLAAAVVEGALQSWAEFGLVLGVIVINTLIGLIQEGKAEKAAEAIKAMLSPTAQVLRDGERQVVQAEQLVPGDIVFIKSGDKVPADLRLLEVNNLQVQEAMLTGESVPVSKNLKPVPAAAPIGDRKCMCYSATAVVSGQATAVVVGTGDSAEIGKINRMVNTVDRVQNNLMHQLEILGRWLAVLVGITAVVAFLLALLRAKQDFRDAFESAVSIAVATIPEGLPAVVTIVLAIGTSVMARNNAIIRQLPAVETLGSLNIICSDKTGTLTKNEMTAVMVRTAAGLYHISGVGYAPVGSFTEATHSNAPSSTSGAGNSLTRSSSSIAITINTTSTTSTASPSSIGTMTTGTMKGNSSLEPVPTKGFDSVAGASLPEARVAALRQLLQGTVLCNDSMLSKGVDEVTHRDTYTPMGAPTEVALITAGLKAGIDQKALSASAPRIKSVPFESEHKFMATVHDENGKRVMYVKGAPDRLLSMCDRQLTGDSIDAPCAPLDVKFWQTQQAELSSQGLRVLALCRAELEASEDLDQLSPQAISQRPPFLAMVMMVAILDPPRDEARQAIKLAHSAGITVKMITGDHSLTALAIARMLGIAGTGAVLTGPEIDRMDDAALQQVVMACNVFARASPENKLRIVRALQVHKQVVAMTGDGVNDAPALKAADVGVAMGITGTDVSKEAAKMVLADDNFASIVAAVREGRRVWDNIRKILIFNLPVNMAQGSSVLYSYILGLDNTPLTALQVLLVNLVTSVTLGLALAAEPVEPTAMSRPPRRAGKRLVGKLLLWRMFFVCHLMVVLVIGSFYWAGQQRLSLRERRAEAFAVLVVSQIAYFVTCRFFKLSTFHPRVLRGNKVALFSVIITLGIMVFLIYTPKVNAFFNMDGMTGMQWARTVVCMAIIYAVVEVEKALVDPVLMPVIRPALRWVEDHTPDWLSVKWPIRNLRKQQQLRAAAGGRTLSAQRTGSMRRQSREQVPLPHHELGHHSHVHYMEQQQQPTQQLQVQQQALQMAQVQGAAAHAARAPDDSPV